MLRGWSWLGPAGEDLLVNPSVKIGRCVEHKDAKLAGVERLAGAAS
jgi:hypothetical protein